MVDPPKELKSAEVLMECKKRTNGAKPASKRRPKIAQIFRENICSTFMGYVTLTLRWRLSFIKVFLDALCIWPTLFLMADHFYRVIFGTCEIVDGSESH